MVDRSWAYTSAGGNDDGAFHVLRALIKIAEYYRFMMMQQRSNSGNFRLKLKGGLLNNNKRGFQVFGSYP